MKVLKIKKKGISIIVISLLVVSTLSVFWPTLLKVSADAPPDPFPPEIGTPVLTPENPGVNQAATVSVYVIDPGVGVAWVTLSYTTNEGGTWTDVSMLKLVGEDIYEATIPGQPSNTTVEYKITAADQVENVAVEDNGGQYFVYSVIPEFSTWQTVVATLVLIGTIIVIMKRRQNKDNNPLTNN